MCISDFISRYVKTAAYMEFRTLYEKYVNLYHSIVLRLQGIKMLAVGIYLLKVNNRNTRTRCEICSKLTLKTPERRQWRSLVPLLLIFNIFHTLF